MGRKANSPPATTTVLPAMAGKKRKRKDQEELSILASAPEVPKIRIPARKRQKTPEPGPPVTEKLGRTARAKGLPPTRTLPQRRARTGASKPVATKKTRQTKAEKAAKNQALDYDAQGRIDFLRQMDIDEDNQVQHQATNQINSIFDVPLTSDDEPDATEIDDEQGPGPMEVEEAEDGLIDSVDIFEDEAVGTDEESGGEDTNEAAGGDDNELDVVGSSNGPTMSRHAQQRAEVRSMVNLLRTREIPDVEVEVEVKKVAATITQPEKKPKSKPFQTGLIKNFQAKVAPNKKVDKQTKTVVHAAASTSSKGKAKVTRGGVDVEKALTDAVKKRTKDLKGRPPRSNNLVGIVTPDPDDENTPTPEPSKQKAGKAKQPPKRQNTVISLHSDSSLTSIKSDDSVIILSRAPSPFNVKPEVGHTTPFAKREHRSPPSHVTHHSPPTSTGNGSKASDIPVSLRPVWKTEVLPSLYHMMYASREPYKHFLQGAEFGNILMNVMNAVVPNHQYDLDANSTIYNVAMQRVLDKRSKILGRARDDVEKWFKGPKYEGNPTEIHKYAKWASHPYGPGLYSSPIPVENINMSTKDPQWVIPTGAFQSQFVINIVKTFVTSSDTIANSRVNPLGNLRGLVAMVAGALEQNFGRFKTGHEVESKTASKGRCEPLTLSYMPAVESLTDDEWKELYVLCRMPNQHSLTRTTSDDYSALRGQIPRAL
ncbi:hypothetical protein BDN72DRAFT_957856 [Pluteus cervinus]|uniref:Uncharacterized protein n=1 Tax=Pluteus cervinus TaxID=181527 RepID=A0ACD3B1N5_9AGAR|nr:hypothetical protein BDN72DRAFT_957856 [Pluteus cervinus]